MRPVSGRNAADDDASTTWLDDQAGRPRAGGVIRRHVGAVAAGVLCLALVAVPVSWVLATSGPAPHADHTVKIGAAEHRVIAALSATIDSGSFNMVYSEQPSTAPTGSAGATTTTCPTFPMKQASPDGPSMQTGLECSSPMLQGIAISGQGTIDINPFAMVASSDVPGIGHVTLRDNGTDVWEIGGGDYGLSPGASDDGPGSSLSGFSGSVEGTLGPRQGALAMKGLASPTGYLELDQNAITSADQIGTGVVDGAPVTVYRVVLDPSQEADVAGTTPDEATAIHAALGVLRQQGYVGTTVDVSIDNGGFIRNTTSVAKFSDGATETSELTLSDFGCAGTVLMPGQSGSSTPPSACSSPDSVTTTTASQ
jgi:hypothetical protein